MAEKTTSMKKKLLVTDIIVHIFLVIVSIVWLIPFIWIVAHSFRGESTTMYCPTFFPRQFTLDNYIKLLTDVDTMNFPRMFMNTFLIAYVQRTACGNSAKVLRCKRHYGGVCDGNGRTPESGRSHRVYHGRARRYCIRLRR